MAALAGLRFRRCLQAAASAPTLTAALAQCCEEMVPVPAAAPGSWSRDARQGGFDLAVLDDLPAAEPGTVEADAALDAVLAVLVPGAHLVVLAEGSPFEIGSLRRRCRHHDELRHAGSWEEPSARFDLWQTA
jgi:hypothetical protein